MLLLTWKKTLTFIGFVVIAAVVQFAWLLHFHLFGSSSSYTGFLSDEVRGQIDLSWLLGTQKDDSDSGRGGNAGSRRSLSDVSLRRHAYAFLMAGCDPENNAYRGYLYNILVAAYILRTAGSKSDVVVLIRMGADAKVDKILPEEEELLRQSDVVVKYLPRARSRKSDSFYTAMIDKFRILELVEYSRVMFMDSDVIPLCNLDYIFDQSDPDLTDGRDVILKENMVVAYKKEPAQGGFFMLRPGPGEFEKLQEVIKKREEKAKDLPWPPFNELWGWGHVIEPPDHWVTLREKGMNWTFYGAFADQGLLYHWVKYVKKSVSIVVRDKVQNWSAQNQDGKEVPHLEGTLEGVLQNASCSQKDPYKRFLEAAAPLRDIFHFTGKAKPWMWNKAPEDIPDGTMGKSAGRLWFHILRKVKAKYNISVDVERLNLGRPPLGMWPTWFEMFQQSEEKANQTANGGDEARQM